MISMSLIFSFVFACLAVQGIAASSAPATTVPSPGDTPSQQYSEANIQLGGWLRLEKHASSSSAQDSAYAYGLVQRWGTADTLSLQLMGQKTFREVTCSLSPRSAAEYRVAAEQIPPAVTAVPTASARKALPWAAGPLRAVRARLLEYVAWLHSLDVKSARAETSQDMEEGGVQTAGIVPTLLELSTVLQGIVGTDWAARTNLHGESIARPPLLLSLVLLGAEVCIRTAALVGCGSEGSSIMTTSVQRPNALSHVSSPISANTTVCGLLGECLALLFGSDALATRFWSAVDAAEADTEQAIQWCTEHLADNNELYKEENWFCSGPAKDTSLTGPVRWASSTVPRGSILREAVLNMLLQTPAWSAITAACRDRIPLELLAHLLDGLAATTQLIDRGFQQVTEEIVTGVRWRVAMWSSAADLSELLLPMGCHTLHSFPKHRTPKYLLHRILIAMQTVMLYFHTGWKQVRWADETELWMLLRVLLQPPADCSTDTKTRGLHHLLQFYGRNDSFNARSSRYTGGLTVPYVAKLLGAVGLVEALFGGKGVLIPVDMTPATEEAETANQSVPSDRTDAAIGRDLPGFAPPAGSNDAVNQCSDIQPGTELFSTGGQEELRLAHVLGYRKPLVGHAEAPVSEGDEAVPQVQGGQLPDGVAADAHLLVGRLVRSQQLAVRTAGIIGSLAAGIRPEGVMADVNHPDLSVGVLEWTFEMPSSSLQRHAQTAIQRTMHSFSEKQLVAIMSR